MSDLHNVELHDIKRRDIERRNIERYKSYAMNRNPLKDIATSIRKHCSESRLVEGFGVLILLSDDVFYILRVSSMTGYISFEKVKPSLEQKWERQCHAADITKYIRKHIPSRETDIVDLLIRARKSKRYSSDPLINRVIHLPIELIAIIGRFLIL